MSETMTGHSELWFDGPNYTADAIIIDEREQKILLIQRRDCGQWALPGGFVDRDESSLAAAAREASEEASIDVEGGQLVYRGVVDDPRNTERAWIETSAYLFPATHDVALAAGDDASDAQWFSLDDLPPLYASHAAIVMRAVDRKTSVDYFSHIPADAGLLPVDGGHMNYTKHIVTSQDRTAFIKSYESSVDADLHVAALEKEAAVMAHLRTADYPHLPTFSHITGQDLFMEALSPEQGWQWRAPDDAIEAYINDCLEAFALLEQLPIPSDTTPIPSALSVYYEQGWQALDNKQQAVLVEFADNMTPLLRPDSQKTAGRLLENLDHLQEQALHHSLPNSYVFCHHDARQANIAWHPQHGTRMVDWSWADIGRPGSDATMLLIDLHKHGHDITPYYDAINTDHCVALVGFWLNHALLPIGERDSTIRLQQYISALAAYEVLEACGSGV